VSQGQSASFGDFWNAIKGIPRKTFLVCLTGVTLSSANQALLSDVIPNITEKFSLDLAVIGQVLSFNPA
jgi:hypothetical protein